jgi:hypothetical protein
MASSYGQREVIKIKIKIIIIIIKIIIIKIIIIPGNLINMPETFTTGFPPYHLDGEIWYTLRKRRKGEHKIKQTI